MIFKPQLTTQISTSIVLCFVISFVVINQINAATFNVTTIIDGSDASPGDGICETALNNGICSLRAAFDEANTLAGIDTINVPVGNYVLSGPAAITNASGSLVISSAIIVNGSDQTSTIIDANNIDRVLSIQTILAVKLVNLSIQNGTAGAGNSGGGINIEANSDLTLDSVTVKNNQANEGAGISAAIPIKQLIINNSIIASNTAMGVAAGVSSKGGGIATNTGTITLLNSSIQNNTANFGGGIYSLGSLRIENSSITGNAATMPDNNTSIYAGGGIQLGSTNAATLVAINSTISGNQTLSTGAGILISNGTVSLYNSTIVNNIADSDNNGFGIGGGIIAGNISNLKKLFISNSIIANNISSGKAPDCSTFNLNIFSTGYNIIGNNSDCIFISRSGDLIGDASNTLDPSLAPLALNGATTMSHALLFNSPAIDSGNSVNCVDDSGTTLSRDQRGQARPIDGGSGTAVCDIGAFETTPFPITKAGTDQIVAFGANVKLNGTASSALAGISAYSWRELPSATVTLNNANTSLPDFIAPSMATKLTFELSVTDNNAAVSSDSVIITVNEPPIARAGADQRVISGITVNLNGNASSDNDGTIASFNWQQTSGTSVALSNNNSETVSFISPSLAGELNFTLTVVDNIGSTHFDSVIITVNDSPNALAGSDRRVNSGAIIQLDGSGSIDTDGSITQYNWVQNSGTQVTLSDATLATPSFTAPDSAGILSFTLTVTDNDGASHVDSVNITVNAAPVANAGADQNIEPGDSVTLSAAASVDNDGSIISYAWQQTKGENVTLNNSSSVTANFIASQTRGSLIFQLSIVDNEGIESNDTVTINVGITPAQPGNANGGGGGGCSLNPSAQFDPLLFLLILMSLLYQLLTIKKQARCNRPVL